MPISTTEFDIILLGQLTRNGFTLGQKCQMGIKFIDGPPDIEISERNGIYFAGKLSIDVMCLRNSQQTHYTQLFTILTQPIKFLGSVSTLLIIYLCFNLDRNH